MTIDPAAQLLDTCVTVLKNTPNGMTTKDLVVEVQKLDPVSFKPLTSSVLSSKLNAIFRRLHGDNSNPTNEQLTDLPLTRAQSVDSPHRLVYKYTPPDIGISHSDESGSSDEEQLGPATPNGSETEYPRSKRQRLSESSSQSSENSSSKANPATPPHEDVMKDMTNQDELPHKLPANKASASKGHHESTALKLKHDNRNVNLYYDVIAYDSLASLVSNDPQNPVRTGSFQELLGGDELNDMETLELNELDNLVC